MLRPLYLDFSGSIRVVTDIPLEDLEPEDLEDLIIREIQNLKDSSPEDLYNCLRIQVDECVEDLEGEFDDVPL